MVACILMLDGFHIAHDVSHGVIEYPAVRGLTKCDDTQECRAVIITTINFVQQVARYEGDKIKCGGFFWRFKRC